MSLHVLDVLRHRRAVHEDEVELLAWRAARIDAPLEIRRVEVAHRRRRGRRQARTMRSIWTGSLHQRHLVALRNGGAMPSPSLASSGERDKRAHRHLVALAR